MIDRARRYRGLEACGDDDGIHSSAWARSCIRNHGGHAHMNGGSTVKEDYVKVASSPD